MKRCTNLVVFLLAGSLWVGCDKKETSAPSAPSESVPQPAEETPKAKGPIAVTEFKIQASQAVMKLEGVDIKALEAGIQSDLHAHESFDPDGPTKGKGYAIFDVRERPESVEVMLVGGVAVDTSVFGELKAEVVVRDADIDDRRVPSLVEEARRRFVKRVGAAAKVKSANDQEILAVLSGDDDNATKLIAVQEARDRRIEGSVPLVRPLLNARDERLQVAAAAMLVSMKDEESYSDVIRITEDFSRDANPQMLPMLYIVADLKTPESRTYLQAVAEGHDSPNVRKVAKEALGPEL